MNEEKKKKNIHEQGLINTTEKKEEKKIKINERTNEHNDK